MQCLGADTWLTVELSSLCNLRCPACAQRSGAWSGGGKGTSAFPEKRQFMDKALFFRLIDELVKNRVGISSINPFFRGESLLHPDFAEMMKYLRNSCTEYPIIEYVVLHTNASCLRDENTEAILNLCDQKVLKHPGNLILSIDAASPEVYSRIRPGGDFGTTMSNIRAFVRERAGRNQWGPDIIFQFIVQENNEKEVMAFIDMVSSVLSSEQPEMRKPFRVVCTPENEPFRPDMDIIYFRLLETLPERQEQERHRYLRVCESIRRDYCIRDEIS